jgi:galacturonosyltransferase 12/13/14/15
MRVYITATASAADDVMKPKGPQKQAARRGCRAAVVTGLLAGLLIFRAALLGVETGAASLCSSSTAGKLLPLASHESLPYFPFSPRLPNDR